MQNNEYPKIQEQIRRRNWKIFCGDLGKGKMNIAKEFYANVFVEVGKESHHKSWVRGKEIDFGRRLINNLLGIDWRLVCHYATRMDYDGNYQTIIRDFCKDGSEWVLDTKGHPNHLKKADLKPIPFMWCSFVQAKLLPTSNHSEVRVKVAMLIHCIVEGHQINIGQLVALNIQQTA